MDSEDDENFHIAIQHRLQQEKLLLRRHETNYQQEDVRRIQFLKHNQHPSTEASLHQRHPSLDRAMALNPLKDKSQEITALTKQVESYKRQNKLLKSKLELDGMTKMQDLLRQLAQKDTQIQILRNQVKALKKISKYQQQGLVQVAGGDGSALIKEKLKLLDENRRLAQRCDQLQKQLRQIRTRTTKSTQAELASKRLRIQQEQNVMRALDYQRKIDSFRTVQTKLYSKVNALLSQIRTLKKEKEQLTQRALDAQRRLDECNIRMSGMRKMHMRLKTVVRQNERDILHLPRMKTLQDAIPMHEKVLPQHCQKSPHKKTSSYNDQEQAPYPRVEERGKSQGSFHSWNDIQFSSKITSVKAWLYKPHNETTFRVNMLYFTYSRGQANHKESMLKQLESSQRLPGNSKILVLNCTQGQFLKSISGAFIGDVLQCVTFGTNLKSKVKWGRESPGCLRFDFNIAQNEMPVCMYGQYIQLEGMQRISKLGCFIDLLDS